MKWPESLSVVRHGQSEYNRITKLKKEMPEYQTLEIQYKAALSSGDFHEQVLSKRWPDDSVLALATEVSKKIRMLTHNLGDFDIPLSEAGELQARKTGKQLSGFIPLPDIIHVSPYLRTKQTLEELSQGWPELQSVKTVEEDRIREQEIGLSIVYGGDVMLYNIFNPQQALLYQMTGPYEYRYLNGENVFDVRDRVRTYLSMLLREHGDQHVLAVTHGLTILSIRANLERWGREHFTEAINTNRSVNCGVTLYKRKETQKPKGRLALEKYNEELYDK